MPPPIAAAMPQLRRSKRSVTVIYDSNGRDYLASITGWTRDQVDEFLTSNSVNPHLQLWYHLGILGPNRFNQVVEMINCGYFYNPDDLEGTVLLMCMGEGNPGIRDPDIEMSDYADQTMVTGKWLTEEVWARTAWRIVQANRGPGQAFEKTIIKHAAAAYAMVIDILCLAFHSIAHRKNESVWHTIITNGAAPAAPPTPSTDVTMSNSMAHEIDNDYDSEASSILGETGVDGNDTDSAASANDSDDDFADDEDSFVASKPLTPKMKRERKMSTPKAPRKTTSSKNTSGGDDITTSPSVRQWVKSLPYDDMSGIEDDSGGKDSKELKMLDAETGDRITGYSRAPAVVSSSDMDIDD